MTNETTLGELLRNPETASAASAMLEKMAGGQEQAEVSESEAALMEALINETPLKSLLIFGVPGEQIEAFIEQMQH